MHKKQRNHSISGSSRVLRAVFLTTVLLALAFPLVNAFIVYPAFLNVLVQSVEKNATLVANHLAPNIFTSVEVEGRTTLSLEELASITAMEHDFNLFKLKVFNRLGVIIYSTDFNDFGQRNTYDYFVDIVAKGQSYTKMVTKGSETMEGERISVDVVETYVPVMMNGHFMGALEFYYDITDRKAEMDRLSRNSILGVVFLAVALVGAVAVLLRKEFQHMALVEQTQKLRGDVERIVQHDIKSPLTNLLSGTNYLQSLEQNQDAREILNQMHTSGWRMMRMINRSLDLYKMEAGTYDYLPEAVDLLEVVRGVITELTDLKSSRQIEVSLLLEGAQPQPLQRFMVPAEEMLCHTLVANLFKNALEGAPRKGHVRIDLRLDSGKYLLEMQNPGVISPEVCEKFFDKYVTSGKKGGTGLGTYSAKLITETQGGTIVVHCGEKMVTIQVRFPSIEEFELG